LLTKNYKIVVLFFILIIYFVFLYFLIFTQKTTHKLIFVKFETHNLIVEKVNVKNIKNNEYNFEFVLNTPSTDTNYDRFNIEIKPLSRRDLDLNVIETDNSKVKPMYLNFNIRKYKIINGKTILNKKVAITMEKVDITFGIYKLIKKKGTSKRIFLNKYKVYLNLNDLKDKEELYFVHPSLFFKNIKKLRVSFIYSFVISSIILLMLLFYKKVHINRILYFVFPAIYAFLPFSFIAFYIGNKILMIQIFILCNLLFFIIFFIKFFKINKNNNMTT